MGIIQKDALRTTIISYLGLILGYINKGVLFVIYLTDAQIGLLSLILTVGLLFAQFSNLGVAYSVWRFFPFFRSKENRNFGFFQLSMLVTLIGIVVFLILSIVFKDLICSWYVEKSKEFTDYYYWLLPIGISYSLFQTMDNFLRSLYKNVVSVIATELLMRLLVTGAIVLYAVGMIDFFTLLVLHSLSFVIPTLVLIVQLFKNKELHLKISDIAIPRRFKKILLTYSLFSYFNFIGILLVISLDIIMVASMVGLAETGVFSTIVYIVSGLLVPYKSLLRISAPFIARYWKERNMVEMKDLYTRISSISLVIGFFVFLVFWVNRTELFHFLRESFHAGIPVFLILMIGRLVDMYCGINGAIFITSKKYKYDLIFTVVLLVSVVGLNFVFIPLYGMYGAALSTTIAYVLYNVARLVFVFYVYDLHPFKKAHLYTIMVFLVSLLIMEQMPVFFGNELISIGLKGILVVTTFIMPIYLLKLDADVVGYLNKIRKKLLPSPIKN